jgi:RNA polymerase sigma factor (sigma-70 family)
MNAGEFLENRTVCSNRGIKQVQNVLLKYCYKITDSKWDAEDLAQETFLKAMRHSKEFYNHENPVAFLLLIAKNTQTDQIRKKQKLVQIVRQLCSVEPFLDDKLVEIEYACQLLIKFLSPLQRTVFVLREIFGYKSSEVAELLQTTEGSIKAALHRARSTIHDIRDLHETDIVIGKNDEAQKEFLKVFVTSFIQGDIRSLVQLALNDFVDPVIVTGAVQNHMYNNHYKRVQNIKFSSSFAA